MESTQSLHWLQKNSQSSLATKKTRTQAVISLVIIVLIL